MMDLANIFTTLGAIGGWEAVKYLLNLKRNRRISESQAKSAEAEAESSEAKADGDEFHVLREMIEFLQTELKEKEVRFSEQTTLLRKANAEIVQVTNEKNAEILRLTEENSALKLELQKYKCVVPKCPKRQPQNGY